jgi:hypothetical protein
MDPRGIHPPGFIARPQPADIEALDPTPSPPTGWGDYGAGLRATNDSVLEIVRALNGQEIFAPTRLCVRGLWAERHGPLSSFRAERSGDPEPSGAREREAVADILPEQIAFGAAGSSDLRRGGAACRRMTIAEDGAVEGLQRQQSRIGSRWTGAV